MRKFYLGWQIPQTLSVETSALLEIPQILSAKSPFHLPWSHHVRLLSVRNPLARKFYEIEALLGGWSIRQLDRQIGSQFYEHTTLSRNKAKMLNAGARACPADVVSPDEEIPDPLVREYRTALPKEQFVAGEITRSCSLLEARLAARGRPQKPRSGRSAGKPIST